jgi:predicted Zn-dependent protease
MEGNQPRVLTFLSDHPATEDRIQHVQSLIKQEAPRGGQVGAEEHQQIKRRLQGTGAQPGR